MELISREEAKRKITEELDSIDHVPSWVFRRLERVISSLPTIEERKEGMWIDHRNEGYVECPFCGSCTTCEDNIDELHFCFNCGNKLKGE